MGKKIKLGSTEPCIFGIKIKNTTENGKNEMLANINGYNIEFGGWTSTPNSVELNGLEVEMDMDELSQGVAYLNEATEGKTTAVDFIKSMVKNSDEILGDDLFGMAAVLVKECAKRTSGDSPIEKHTLLAAQAVLEYFYS